MICRWSSWHRSDAQNDPRKTKNCLLHNLNFSVPVTGNCNVTTGKTTSKPLYKVTAHQLCWEFFLHIISDGSAALSALTKHFSVPLCPPPFLPLTVPPPFFPRPLLTFVGPGLCGCLTPVDWKKRRRGLLRGNIDWGDVRACVCSGSVDASKCWRYTGLSCFLSPANPTTHKPLWSRGSRQFAVTRHVQHGWGGLDWGPRTPACQCHIITVT